MYRSTILTMAALLAACAAPMDRQRVEQHPAAVLETRVDADYATVHRRILDGLRYCFMEQPTRRQLVVHDHRDKTHRTGEVVLADVFGKKGESLHWLARTRAEDGATHLTVLVARKGWKDEAALVPRWAEGHLECGRFAPAPPEEEKAKDDFLSLR